MTSLEIITTQMMIIKILFKNLKNVVNEANLEFINDGLDNKYLKINVLDPTKSLLMNVKLNGSEFSKFECIQNKLVLGIDTNSFSNLLDSANHKDVFKLSMYQNNPNICEMKLCHIDDTTSTFNIKPIDIAINDTSMPAITFTAVITMDSIKFYKLCTKMNKMADQVEIKCFPDKIIFACVKNGIEMKSTFMATDDHIGIIYQDNKNSPPFVSNIFEIKKLLLMSKYSPLSNTVDIFMKNDFPLTAKYNIGTLGRILILLTPIEKKTIHDKNDNDIDIQVKSPTNAKISDVFSFEICI